jgi:hypothetical protein
VLRNYYGPKTTRFALFHASAVSDGKRAILFLGQHARGKSTLLRGFVGAGFRYLADDMVAFGLEDGLVYPTLPVDHRLPPFTPSYPVPLGTVFVVEYTPGGETEIGEIDPSQAYLYAVENLLNPRSLDRETLRTLLDAIKEAEAYRTRHADWTDILRFYSFRSL